MKESKPCFGTVIHGTEEDYDCPPSWRNQERVGEKDVCVYVGEGLGNVLPG